MKKLFFAFIISTSLLTSCSKASIDSPDSETACWYLIDNSGNQVDTKCGMSEKQIAHYAKANNLRYSKKR